MNDSAKPTFWLEKWQAGQIRFHQKEFEPLLIKYSDILAGGSVLVPLCGKSLDMVWLAKQGHSVLGVELIALACEAFFSENFPDEKPVMTQTGSLIRYRLGKITLICGDFFKLTPADCQDITAIYDRAALIALPPELRERYVTHLKTLSGGRTSPLLLVTLEYPPGLMQAPPFSVSPDEVNSLYSDRFSVTHLETEDISEDFGYKKSADTWVLQHAFKLS